MEQYDLVYEGDLAVRCTHASSGSVLLTDAPQEVSGHGKAFSPTDLLAAALGTCVLTVMAMMADRLKVDFSGTNARVVKEMAHTPERRVGMLKVEVHCPRSYPPEVIQKLQEAARGCPVHRSLHPSIDQTILFYWGAS